MMTLTTCISGGLVTLEVASISGLTSVGNENYELSGPHPGLKGRAATEFVNHTLVVGQGLQATLFGQSDKHDPLMYAVVREWAASTGERALEAPIVDAKGGARSGNCE
jgi:hypothetical protein